MRCQRSATRVRDHRIRSHSTFHYRSALIEYSSIRARQGACKTSGDLGSWRHGVQWTATRSERGGRPRMAQRDTNFRLAVTPQHCRSLAVPGADGTRRIHAPFPGISSTEPQAAANQLRSAGTTPAGHWHHGFQAASHWRSRVTRRRWTWSTTEMLDGTEDRKRERFKSTYLAKFKAEGIWPSLAGPADRCI